MTKIENPRPLVVTGITKDYNMLIIAYLFNKCLVNVSYISGDHRNFSIDPHSDYIFLLTPPDIDVINIMKTIDSAAIILSNKNKSSEYDNLQNVSWLNDGCSIKSAFRLLKSYSANIDGLNLDKLTSIKKNNLHIKICADILVSGLLSSKLNIEFKLAEIFLKFDKLFNLSNEEIFTIGKYYMLSSQQYMVLNAQQAILQLFGKSFNVAVCETHKQSILYYLKDEWLTLQSLIPEGNPSDIAMIINHDFISDIDYFHAIYRKDLDISPFKKILKVKIDEDARTISGIALNFRQYFKRHISFELKNIEQY